MKHIKHIKLFEKESFSKALDRYSIEIGHSYLLFYDNVMVTQLDYSSKYEKMNFPSGFDQKKLEEVFKNIMVGPHNLKSISRGWVDIDGQIYKIETFGHDTKLSSLPKGSLIIRPHHHREKSKTTKYLTKNSKLEVLVPKSNDEYSKTKEKMGKMGNADDEYRLSSLFWNLKIHFIEKGGFIRKEDYNEILEESIDSITKILKSKGYEL